LKRKGRKGK